MAMMLMLSPSKTVDFETPAGPGKYTEPRFLAEAVALMARLKQLDPDQLAELMSMSEALTESTFARLQDWHREQHALPVGKPAVLAYTGTVFQGLNAADWSLVDGNYAQAHVRILDALYGVLRPRDLILPYRLDFKTPLTPPEGDSLYDYWRERITAALNDDLQRVNGKIILNLASNEYARLLDKRGLNGRLVDVSFKDKRRGSYRVIAVYAKEMRGVLARFVVRQRGTGLNDLYAFAANGYVFDEARSSPKELVYTRE